MTDLAAAVPMYGCNVNVLKGRVCVVQLYIFYMLVNEKTMNFEVIRSSRLKL